VLLYFTMRIAVFIKATTFNRNFGGLEIQNKLLCEGLAEAGHAVYVISPRPGSELGSEVRDQRLDNLVYQFVGAPPGKYSPAWWKESSEVFRELHKEKPFAVVISQSMAGQAVVEDKDDFGVPVVVIQHGTIWGELRTRLRSAEHLRDYLFFLRLVPYGVKVYIKDQLRLRRADAVIAVSDQVRDALVSEYFLSRGRITVVYNGINQERFRDCDGSSEARVKLGLSTGNVILLYVGRVEKEKGLEVFLEAVSRLAASESRVKAVVVGDGGYLENLKATAERLGVDDHVIFKGRVSYEEVPEYYAAADIFVLPSLREEGLPMTLPEAMAAGLPVVASRIGGIPSVIESRSTGILVPPGDSWRLSEALADLIRDEGARRRLGANATRLVERKLSQTAMVEGTLRVLYGVRRQKEK